MNTCAARSGGTVYAYAEAQWDGPALYGTASDTFDGAKIRLQIMHSQQGTDPVVMERDFQIKDQLQRGDRNGRYRTPVINHRAGSGAYGDLVLFLDWHGDGHGYQHHDYKGTSTV
ncbi:hypothetical protein ACFWBF_37045 [Streptomyces sp. NPDC060028]|uniref:hypothetical protein n=1 Tax=Streptomyces sp. NPDC060028 TaxID=3347041 RepID=UPI0036A52DBE